MSNFDQEGRASKKNAQQWLLSKNRFESTGSSNFSFGNNFSKKNHGPAKTISITSGKGGVGKTSMSIKMGKMLASRGYKVLLIDCDYNLSNTSLKLGLPMANNFGEYIKGHRRFEDCLYRDESFHLFAACNGDLDIFENESGYSREVINILVQNERYYDFILLDSPAGLAKDSLTLNAYCDYRFVVVTPDKSSITDSYSLIKILNNKYGIHENHLILNKISNNGQYKRIVKSLSETVESFLSCRLHILGGVNFESLAVDKFDGLLMEEAESSLHETFVKVLDRFTEEVDGGPALSVSHLSNENICTVAEQDVQPSTQCS